MSSCCCLLGAGACCCFLPPPRIQGYLALAGGILGVGGVALLLSSFSPLGLGSEWLLVSLVPGFSARAGLGRVLTSFSCFCLLGLGREWLLVSLLLEVTSTWPGLE